MNPFAYTRTVTADQAIHTVTAEPGAAFFAGGTTLLDLMKLDVMTPEELVDINSVPLADVRLHNDTVRIGALAG